MKTERQEDGQSLSGETTGWPSEFVTEWRVEGSSDDKEQVELAGRMTSELAGLTVVRSGTSEQTG